MTQILAKTKGSSPRFFFKNDDLSKTLQNTYHTKIPTQEEQNIRTSFSFTPAPSTLETKGPQQVQSIRPPPTHPYQVDGVHIGGGHVEGVLQLVQAGRPEGATGPVLVSCRGVEQRLKSVKQGEVNVEHCTTQ